MGLTILFILIFAIFLYLAIEHSDNNLFGIISIIMSVITGIGIITAAVIWGVGEPEKEFFNWLDDRKTCELNIDRLDELDDYEKLKIIHLIKENNDELDYCLYGSNNILLEDFFSESYNYFKPLTIPEFTFNARKEETINK